MKKLILISVLFLGLISNGQENYAQVQKVNGIEVYILAKPLRAYEVVMDKNNSVQWSSFVTGGLINESIATKVTKFVKGTKEKAEKEGIDFDAIVYTDGKDIIAVKFTEAITPENNRMAVVQKIDGMAVYVMNEPVADYKVVTDKGPGMKWKSFLTGGIVNNSIEQDMEKYCKRLKDLFDAGEIQAVIYTSGKTASGITLQ
ncbi:MAG: hypothetical protein RQ735_06650 [Flavobacteriaceae bacterium]|nr:hypothetical protein [Flavobacteriaceae bacterium]